MKIYYHKLSVNLISCHFVNSLKFLKLMKWTMSTVPGPVNAIANRTQIEKIQVLHTITIV